MSIDGRKWKVDYATKVKLPSFLAVPCHVAAHKIGVLMEMTYLKEVLRLGSS